MKLEWNKRSLAYLALLAFLLGAGGLWALYNNGSLNTDSAPIHLEKNFDAAALRTITVHADTTDVSVTRSSDSQIHLALSGTVAEVDVKYAKIDANVTGSGLDVTFKTTKNWMVGLDINRLAHEISHGFNSSTKAEVALPDQLFDKLSVQTDTGTIRLAPIQANALSLHTDTGDLELEKFTGTKLDATTDTGDMKLMDLTGTVNANSDTGDIELSFPSIEHNVTVNTDTGDIQMSSDAQGSKGLKVDFRSDTGHTTATADGGKLNLSVDEKHHLVGVLGEGGPLVKARSDTGSISLDISK